MSFRAGGSDVPTDEELKLVHWECDSEGCKNKTQHSLSEGLAQKYAAQEGWSISDEGAFCPKHRYDRKIGEGFEVEEVTRGLDFGPADLGPPAPVIQRVEVAPPVLLILVSVLALSVAVLALLLVRAHSDLWSAGISLTRYEEYMFERNGDIHPLACSSMFETPRRCSGVMSTEGKPDVPVRYTCGADDCRFDK